MQVIKRDGSKEEFNFGKIRNAILKAFKACSVEPTEKDYQAIDNFLRTA